MSNNSSKERQESIAEQNFWINNKKDFSRLLKYLVLNLFLSNNNWLEYVRTEIYFFLI